VRFDENADYATKFFPTGLYCTTAFVAILMLTRILLQSYTYGFHWTKQIGCLYNLRQIDSAKEQWAMEQHKPKGAVPTRKDLAPAYMKDFPACPAGGTYSIHSIGADPTCSIKGHDITAPRD
jgi:general secretion pathway protein G